MSEPIETPTEQETELETLKLVNQEILQKSSARKARIKELESTVATLEASLSESQDVVKKVTVDGPVKAMCESLSIAPEIFQEKFLQRFKVELVKGELKLFTVDGKPVMNGQKPVPFERKAILELLTASDDPQSKIYKSILIASRASGSGATGSGRSSGHSSTSSKEEIPTKPTVRFGLR